MTKEVDNAPVCSVCGKEMCKGNVAVRINRFTIRHFEGWYCPNSPNA
jgi:hypothetical protein